MILALPLSDSKSRHRTQRGHLLSSFGPSLHQSHASAGHGVRLVTAKPHARKPPHTSTTHTKQSLASLAPHTQGPRPPRAPLASRLRGKTTGAPAMPPCSRKPLYQRKTRRRPFTLPSRRKMQRLRRAFARSPTPPLRGRSVCAASGPARSARAAAARVSGVEMDAVCKLPTRRRSARDARSSHVNGPRAPSADARPVRLGAVR